MASDRTNGPGFYERIAGTIPAAAFSTRCGATAGPRLERPRDRRDLASPDALLAALGPRWTGIQGEPAPRRLALGLLASQTLLGRDRTLRAMEGIAGRLADAREADLASGASRMLRAVVGGTPGEVGEASRLGLECAACYEGLVEGTPDIPGRIAVLASGHAYGSTAYLAVLQAAKRADGVLPDAYFLWLRPIDMPGWVLTTDHGRLSRFVGAVAANVHHAAEVAAGRPLPDPDMREPARLLAPRVA